MYFRISSPSLSGVFISIGLLLQKWGVLDTTFLSISSLRISACVVYYSILGIVLVTWLISGQFSCRVWLFVTSWTAVRQASLSITNSQSVLKLMSVTLVMPSNHLSLCHSLFLLASIFPSIRVFSNESVFHIIWPKYWGFMTYGASKYMVTQ